MIYDLNRKMKKILLHFSIFILGFSFAAKAQILDAVGVAAGATFGKHQWNPSEFNTQERYIWGFNGAGMVEFFHGPTFRWRVEVEYNQMGSKELIYQEYKNRTTYITLNNYLKIQYRLNWIMPYILVGPRVEYLLINRPQIYGDVIGRFPKFWFTGAAGVGFELINRSLWRPFIEGFYNRDILPSYRGSYITTAGNIQYSAIRTIYYTGFEARIGIRYVFDQSDKKAKCPKVINPMGN